MDRSLITVVMSSYNHEYYVKDAINSVLMQTYDNLEFIITDDGSIDNTVDEIKKIQDDRIKLFCFDKNQGACSALNNSINHARGKYIALINSDDIWVYDKLEKQLEFIERNKQYSAIFSNAIFKNQYMEHFQESERPSFFDIFKQENKSRSEWLRQFFFHGNSICHPSMLIKTEVYREIGLYNNIFRQLPDFDMWIRLIKKYDLYIMNEDLVYFRLIGNENVSSPTIVNQIRIRNESHLIMKNFFRDISIELFKESFSKYLIKKDFSTDTEFECEKAMLFINHSDHHKIIGYEILSNLLSNHDFAKIIDDHYNFSYSDFMKLSGELLLFKNQGNIDDEKIISTIDAINHLKSKIINTPKKNIIKHIIKFIKNILFK